MCKCPGKCLLLTQDGLQISSQCEYSFKSFFLYSFQNVEPRIDTNGSFMFLVSVVLFSLLLFGLLMFCKYCIAMSVSVFHLCSFSVKISIKKSFWLWRYFSAHILYACERKPSNTPIVIFGAIYESDFICTFIIDGFWKILKSYKLLPLFLMTRS